MSQNIINDLTDRVSALQGDVSRLRAAARAEATSAQIHYEARRELEEKLFLRDEWIKAIRLEITARRKQADLATIIAYANGALDGEPPEWVTPEYRAKVQR